MLDYCPIKLNDLEINACKQLYSQVKVNFIHPKAIPIMVHSNPINHIITILRKTDSVYGRFGYHLS